jgi:APA family basic amino acid/polyamine antiporter
VSSGPGGRAPSSSACVCSFEREGVLTGTLLERRLGLGSATALVVGEVIAVGIFLTPAEMAKALGSPLRILLVWSAVGLAAFSGALCYGELAARYPEAGGGYVYLREAWGPGLAFLYGWKSLLVMDPGVTAALAAGLAQYAGALVPLSRVEAKGVAMLAIVLIGIVHALGVGVGAGLLRALTVLKLVLLAAIVIGGLASGRGHWSHFVPFTELRAGSPPAMAGLAAGVVAAFFSFGGFWDAAKLAGEVEDPAHTLPRALGLGVAVVTLVYVATSAVFIYLVPIEGASSGAAFAAQVGEVLLGPSGARALSAVVVIAVLGSLAAILLAAPRVYYAMARDGVFLRAVAAVHPRLRTPARAIGVQVALACLLVAVGSFEDIVAYFVFITVVFVALTVAGLYRLPRPAKGAYRVPGYPVTPLGFLALLAVLLVLLAVGRPLQAALGTAVVALGIPVYLLITSARRRGAAVGAPLEDS